MSHAKQIASALTIALAISLLLAGCGKTVVVQPVQTPAAQPTQNPQQAPPSAQAQAEATPIDGQAELVRREPDPKPAWTISPEIESDQEYLAFKGRSRDAAQQGCLAAARRAEQAGDAAGFKAEIDAVDDGMPAVALNDAI